MGGWLDVCETGNKVKVVFSNNFLQSEIVIYGTLYRIIIGHEVGDFIFLGLLHKQSHSEECQQAIQFGE